MEMRYNLADLFECVADHVPDRDCVVYGERRLSFRDIDTRATRLAHFLGAQGVGPGDRVGIYAYNCNEWIESGLAAFKLRAFPVNINFRYVEDELRYLLRDSEPSALIYHRELAPRVAAAADDVPSIRTRIVIEDSAGPTSPAPPAERGQGSEVPYESALAAGSPERDFGERSGDDLFVVYTGGTTGMPKGVMWRQEDVFFSGLQGGNPGGPPITAPEQIGPNAAAREAPPTTLPVAPLMHGNGYWASLIGMHGGGKVVLATSRRMDPREIWSLVEREKVNVMSIVGDAMARPLAEALYEPDANYDLSSLLVISSAGVLWSDHVKERLRGKLKALLIDAFGASEAGHQGMNLGANSDGKLRFSIVDPNTAVLDDGLRRVAPGSGVVGRLARAGRIPLGYWRDEEKTARTFVTDADGVRWVIPGDHATVNEDGTMTLLGRGSLCINSGGEKIYPEEVEQALKSHPAVFDAVVVGVPDERWGERVAAVVQPRAGAAPTLADLDAHCRAHIAGYKVPRQLSVVSEIVRSPSGKADYRWAKETAMK